MKKVTISMCVRSANSLIRDFGMKVELCSCQRRQSINEVSVEALWKYGYTEGTPNKSESLMPHEGSISQCACNDRGNQFHLPLLSTLSLPNLLGNSLV